MTKEEIKTPREEHDRLKKREQIALVAIGYIALIGGVVLIFAVVQAGFYEQIQSNDYLTDDGIAYRDLQNATYTYEQGELNDLRDNAYTGAVVGGAIFGAAVTAFFIMAYINPANTTIRAHKIYCHSWETAENPEEAKFKHCPECGLKLSKLEEKRHQ